jgi:hypothetical protein
LRTAIAVDAICAAAITIISALPYLSHLGFYADDWSFLVRASSGAQSFVELVGEGFPARPFQGIYSLLLFRTFGLDPLGYHVVNTAMLASSAALLCLLLARLKVGRAQSFASALLFVMLPQLSTARAWYGAFAVPLSLALMLLSMHCQLSFAHSRKSRWFVAAIVPAVLSIATHEIFTPLIAAFAIALLFLEWRRSGGKLGRGLIAAAAVVLAILMLAFIYKIISASGRAGSIGDPGRYLAGLRQLFRVDYDWRVDSGLNVFAMLRTYFWAPVHGWWSGAQLLVAGKTSLEVAAIALLVAGLSLWRLGTKAEVARPEPALRLLVLGIAAFLLGNATFLIVPAIVFTSTGMDNRVQGAAALGVAMMLVALISLGANALPPRHRARAFGAAVSVVSASAFVRMSSIEEYWARGPALQQRVLTAARTDLRSVPPHSTIILDGVCPYFGPAVIFETSWDVGGALTLTLGRPLAGDAVSPRMSLTASGLKSSIYKQPSFYPYGPGLYAYNAPAHRLVQLKDAETAVRYFNSRTRMTCTGLVARGSEV